MTIGPDHWANDDYYNRPQVSI